MDEQIIQDILTEVFSSLEPLDAQTSAILQFLKAKGLATDGELAPFLEQAGNASNVRWLAARVRIASLLSSALNPAPHSAASPPASASPASSPPPSIPRRTLPHRRPLLQKKLHNHPRNNPAPTIRRKNRRKKKSKSPIRIRNSPPRTNRPRRKI